MAMTVVFGLHKFSLQATIIVMNHVCILAAKHLLTVTKTFHRNDSTITDFEMIDTQYSFTAYVVIYKLITYIIFWGNGTRGCGCHYSHDVGTSSPSQ